MSQNPTRNPKVPDNLRWGLALLAGLSPLMFALVVVAATGDLSETDRMGWTKYLVEHLDDLVQSLILSSVMVAVFIALLRCAVATLLTALQPLIIQALFIFTDPSRGVVADIPLLAITLLPLVVLLVTLTPLLRQIYDRQDAETD